MNKVNPLAGLIGNYGDSDDSDDEPPVPATNAEATARTNHGVHAEIPMQPPGVQPAPIPHCPWSACYDESSGFTYYWNQQTNAVTWETPPEYLLALRLAQQQLHTPGPSEVSAEEWHLYQQALVEKQGAYGKAVSKPAMVKPAKTNQPNKLPVDSAKNNNVNKKRRISEPEEEKIELITSYHNSDSESNDEPESPVKEPTPQPPAKVLKSASKKPKVKPSPVPYGPALPPNQNYTVPIGPEMPPDVMNGKPTSPEASKAKDSSEIKDEGKKSALVAENEDSQDEAALLLKLKDKAQLLESLGGEIPSEIHKMIYENTYTNATQKSKESIDAIDNIDDLLNEIEKKELPKIKSKKLEMFNESSNDAKSKDEDMKNSPKVRDTTPPIEYKPLFPSIKNINEDENTLQLKGNSEERNGNSDKNEVVVNAADKKGANLYLMNTNEPVEVTQRKKFRISNSVLPERKKTESPVYTTKYAESIDGTTERTGLGFNKDEQEEESPKNTISYGNGLTFTKGETLNEEKRDEDLDDLTELVEAKLKYLNQVQPCNITPVQEMLIQMQTLVVAFRAGALCVRWWRRWAQGAARALLAHEARAAPPGWTCAFHRSEGRYQYRREWDGLVQWEYPAVANTDMDISTTPPHPGLDGKDEPPLSLSPEVSILPGGACGSPPAAAPPVPPPAPSIQRAQTPPPPAWADPPPPGCDEPPPLPTDHKREIGDELMSFYNDIAELEKQTSAPHTACNSPEAPSPPIIEPKEREREKEKDIREKDRIHRDRDREQKDRERARIKEREREKEREKESKISKKKNKVKISTSMGMKHKTVSSLVAKWQQVADEIHSD